MTKIGVLLLIFLLNIGQTVAYTVTPIPQELPNKSMIDDGDLSSIIDAKQRDLEILKSMDNLGDQLDIIGLDKQQKFIESKSDNELLNNIDKIEQSPLIDDDVLLDEGFDDLTLDDFNLDEKLDKPIDIGTSNSEVHVNEVLKNKTIEKPKIFQPHKNSRGVGIRGKEERLINQLDQSELIDIESELESLVDELEQVPPEIEDWDGYYDN